MRLLYIFGLFLILSSCTKNKITYWCGDHPCVNKSEKETYFKETMIVEVKDLDNIKNEKYSEVEKIILQAQDKKKTKVKNKKKISKINKLEQKRKKKEQKILLKKQKLIEKERLKEEKAQLKREKSIKKKRLKEEKSLAKQIKKDEKTNSKKLIKEAKKNKTHDDNSKNTVLKLSNFQKIVKEINRRNNFRDYPDINDIPN